ncbi:hypothetical protein CASFOL_020504 [Castilleja foliolosa]|uniref:Protein RER1 n=1 Tax=Castilleja foliolosa TaxID=1961234 RepID=A0ABD3D5B1_9LAMI
MEIKNRLQYYSDKLKPQFYYRWMVTFVLACFYAIRVYLYGYYFLTYLLGIILTFLVNFLLTTYIDDDPDEPVSLDAPPILPTKASDELRPFVPFLPEYNFWCKVNKVLCVFLGLTFIIPSINFPAGVWYVYLIIWLYYTALVLIQHRVDMIKYNYIPFYYGDKSKGVYKGK